MRETADIIGEVAAVCMERLGRREGAWNGVRAVRGGANAVIVQPGAGLRPRGGKGEAQS